MRAVKASWYRPAYGYAAATVCIAIAAWAAASPPPTLGIVQALYQTDRDTQLPLERFAIDADNMAASSPAPPVSRQPRSTNPPQWSRKQLRLTAQPTRPGQRVSSDAYNSAAQAEHGTAGSGASNRKSGVNGYFRKIDDSKYWT